MKIEELKKDYPKTWAKFIEYLRNNYEFWEKGETSEKTLWFCERKFETQLGYFIGWIETMKLTDLQQKHWDPNDTMDIAQNVTDYFKKALPLMFKYLESKVK